MRLADRVGLGAPVVFGSGRGLRLARCSGRESRRRAAIVVSCGGTYVAHDDLAVAAVAEPRVRLFD